MAPVVFLVALDTLIEIIYKSCLECCGVAILH
jgi:hypothetical protein